MPNPKSKIPRPDLCWSRGGQNPKSQAILELTSGSVDQTQALGERLGHLLQAGDVVALYGELGSGKTTLIQGIARGLGQDAQTIKSPTFVLMREYRGQVPLVHLDGYRLDGAPAVSWLDLDLLLSPHKITVIEWAQRCEGLLPDDRLEVHLEHASTNRRRLRLSSTGPRSATVVSQMPQHQKASEGSRRLEKATKDEDDAETRTDR